LKVKPVSSDRFRIEIVVDRSTHDKLRYAQELLSHSVPTGDVAQLLERALDALIAQSEKRKFHATARPRVHRVPSHSDRYVPAQVCRAVWKRDGGQCTFVGRDGHRCGERWKVELDHIVPVARGGRATMESMRLRCHAHNQYEAERVFGREFMRRKREQAREKRPQQPQPEDEMDKDVMAALRELKVPGDVAKRAMEHSKAQGGVTLEERVRDALKFLWPRNVRRVALA
jgi:5-methylcytosine-specific restriction endonuclease McrA